MHNIVRFSVTNDYHYGNLKQSSGIYGETDKKARKKYLAVDIGASNGRCIAGLYDGDTLSLEMVARFGNGFIRLQNHLYWNILALWDSVRSSLAKAGQSGDVVSIGVDTWGVDFGLLNRQDQLVGNPYAYRDPQTKGMLEKAFKIVAKQELFQRTGIQFMELNTLYQLMAMLERNDPALQTASTLLMTPDLLNFWLTGQKVAEYTIASTSQLMNASTRQWDKDLMARFTIPQELFPEIVMPGEVIAPVNQALINGFGLPQASVIAVGSHDTAAAVAAVPASNSDFAYLSSGTWGLLGTELPIPALSPAILESGFGNEGGVFDTIRLLRNIVNMWMVQECHRIWAEEGQDYSWDELSELAREAPAFLAFIDPDDPRFLLPANMPQAIQEQCRETGQDVPYSPGEIFRVCLESLAMKYRYSLEKLAWLLEQKPDVFHIVGGAARNTLLNQFAANATNRPVLAGPYEATAIGNLIVQMVAGGELADLWEGRELIRRSFPVKTFLPQDATEWDARYQAFLQATKLAAVN
jgi:sugar (pentulose or hexulose) kinase